LGLANLGGSGSWAVPRAAGDGGRPLLQFHNPPPSTPHTRSPSAAHTHARPPVHGAVQQREAVRPPAQAQRRQGAGGGGGGGAGKARGGFHPLPNALQHRPRRGRAPSPLPSQPFYSCNANKVPATGPKTCALRPQPTPVASSSRRQVAKKHFNLRLCPEDVSDRLSGFGHNGVSPVGLATPLPVILSHRITRLAPDFFFMGGAAGLPRAAAADTRAGPHGAPLLPHRRGCLSGLHSSLPCTAPRAPLPGPIPTPSALRPAPAAAWRAAHPRPYPETLPQAAARWMLSSACPRLSSRAPTPPSRCSSSTALTTTTRAATALAAAAARAGTATRTRRHAGGDGARRRAAPTGGPLRPAVPCDGSTPSACCQILSPRVSAPCQARRLPARYYLPGGGCASSRARP
jgi:hypothetical protein